MIFIFYPFLFFFLSEMKIILWNKVKLKKNLKIRLADFHFGQENENFSGNKSNKKNFQINLMI